MDTSKASQTSNIQFHTYQHSHAWLIFFILLKSNLFFAQISKNKPTNPSPYLHADVHLPPTRYVPAKPKATESNPARDIAITTTTSTIAPDTTIVPPVSPATKKRLLIRLEVEEGKLVSESYQYTDWLTGTVYHASVCSVRVCQLN